jgi:hypothetical protein
MRANRVEERAPLKKRKVEGQIPTRKPKIVQIDEPRVKLPKRVTKKSLALIEPKRLSKIGKEDKKDMRSILGDAAEDIQQMLERNNNDSAISLMQKRMLQTVVDLIPYAEHNVRESKGARGVYQINSLITSLRELMIDMQSTRDKGAIGDAMVEKVIRPSFLDIGMNVVLEDERVLKELREVLPLEDYRKVKAIHQDSLARTAKFIQDKYGEAKQQAISFLQQ